MDDKKYGITYKMVWCFFFLYFLCFFFLICKHRKKQPTQK